MEQLPPNIITTALAAATIAKVLVDLLRATQRLPSWASPVLALVGGELAAFLLLLAGGGILTPATAAQTMLAGILAASTAVGATELQRREKRDVTAYTGELIELLETPLSPQEPRRDG